LVSHTIDLPANSIVSEPTLVFNFGFGTDEPFQDGFIFDSFSARVQTLSRSQVLTVVTADRTGVYVTPETPGGVVLTPGALVSVLTDFPSLQPALGVTAARNFRIALPATMADQPLELTFELFDNLNNVRSVGAFWDVHVVLVPEPSTVSLFLLGGLFIWIRRNR
jgi:hypothetical protein